MFNCTTARGNGAGGAGVKRCLANVSRQIDEEAKRLAAHTGYATCCVVGGQSIEEQASCATPRAAPCGRVSRLFPCAGARRGRAVCYSLTSVYGGRVGLGVGVGGASLRRASRCARASRSSSARPAASTTASSRATSCSTSARAFRAAFRSVDRFHSFVFGWLVGFFSFFLFVRSFVCSFVRLFVCLFV